MLRRILTVFASLRIPMLLFAVPYALLWTRTSESGGWIMVIAHAALVLFAFAGVDASLIKRGREPRLTLRRASELFDLRVIEVAHAVLGITALIAGFVLLFIQWKLGAVVLVALVLMELGADGFSSRWRHNRFAWSEYILPLVMLIAPAMLIAGSAKSRLARLHLQYDAALEKAESAKTAISADLITDAHERVRHLADQIDATHLMPQPVVAATFLGALALAAFTLLALRRDEMLDRGENLRTTPTRAGRAFSSCILILMLAATCALAIYGVDAHHTFGSLIGIQGGMVLAHRLPSSTADTPHRMGQRAPNATTPPSASVVPHPPRLHRHTHDRNVLNETRIAPSP
ncbi:MAG: hypothetical protein R3B46_07775 [Phycisphaerales bacterium]